MDNKILYETSEFGLWNHREGLLAQERYFLTKYTSREDTILEAGTGGGRISYKLEKMGYSHITAFDYVEKMITSAKTKNPHTSINFLVADATDLSTIASNTFDRLIYLQQIISFIPEKNIPKALNESYRILVPEGIVIFSFLNWKGRIINPLLSALLTGVRFFRNEQFSKQSLPWLKLGNKPNWKLLFHHQPLTYWFTREELITQLETLGFVILEIKTSSDFISSSSEGMLYIVCQKKAKP
jgi:ubiquinone/menaquinone biosynthesis C-methylase UbiE